MTRDAASHTPVAIITDDKENSPRLYHATLYKTLKDMVDYRIKPAMEAKFTPLQSMFTQQMEDTINQRIITLANITAEAMNRTIHQIREDYSRIRSQVAVITRDVQSTMATKVTPTWSPPPKTTPLQLISDPEVVPAAAERHIPRQQAAGRPVPQPLHAPLTLPA